MKLTIFYFHFRCFVGTETALSVENCIERDTNNLNNPQEISRSVSEMKEWVCSKIDRPDGTVVRDCMSMYTGGELFDVCLTNSFDGRKCLCSAELCNHSIFSKTPNSYLIILSILTRILWHRIFCLKL